MENACDDSWTPFFEQSFADWNETEALILSSRRVSYDATCEPSQGRLKVCNGDYGNTDWRGINSAIISVSTDYLVYSISKLNDFHLKTDDDKLYTMYVGTQNGAKEVSFCQCAIRNLSRNTTIVIFFATVGVMKTDMALGTCVKCFAPFFRTQCSHLLACLASWSERNRLPHTDEDHFNKDRGDCMDYTVRTWNNLKPGKYNLNLLETLYGTPTQPLLSDPLAGDVSAGGGTPVSPPTTSSPPLRPRPQTPQPRPNWGNQDEEDENEDDRRRRRQLHSKVEILMDTCQGAQCVYSIDDEYTVVINKLFV